MKRATSYFRAGVGAVILDDARRVLVCERADIAGAWQFPQGGLKKRESPVQAVYREVHEETGIPRASLRFVDRYPDLLAYELPREARSIKTGMGQVQYWFYVRLKEPGVVIHLPPGSEFKAFAWISFNTAVARAVKFKRPLYRKLQEYFEVMAPRRGSKPSA
jgi:putative (di)nucleoside polyphosphate hydrolase